MSDEDRTTDDNLRTSIIRTIVPIVVGSVTAWLVSRGIEVNDEVQTQFTNGLTGLISAGYYVVVRLIERRVPWVGAFLGRRATPTYDKAA